MVRLVVPIRSSIVWCLLDLLHGPSVTTVGPLTSPTLTRVVLVWAIALLAGPSLCEEPCLS